MNKRLLAGVAAAGIIGGGVYGFAATLGLDSDTVSANNDEVASCDTNGVDVDYTVVWDADEADYTIDKVTVSDIADACAGDQIGVTLEGATLPVTLPQEAVVGNAGTTADDNTAEFEAAASELKANLINDVHVVIAG
jgi:hypothetical protein